MENILINIGLYLTYVLFAIALVALLIFSIVQFIGNIGKSKETLFGLIGLLVVFAISYIISSPTDISESLFEKVGTDYGMSKLIGSGLIAFYILFVIAIVALLVSEVTRPFKK